MALVNYRRRAGNLIDRDKRSNCWEGAARTYIDIYIYFFFHVARYEINPWHTALRVLAPLSASTWGDDKKHHRNLVFFEVLARRVGNRRCVIREFFLLAG